MNETQQKLDDLIKETGIEIEKKFLKKDFYFDGDKEKRNIREIKITRDNRTMSFTFGDSIVNTNKKTTTISKHRPYERTEKSILQKPNDYDVMACLQADYTDNLFEDRCDNFGYDNDSIKAHKTYQSCVEKTIKMRKIFTYKEIEKLLSFEF